MKMLSPALCCLLLIISCNSNKTTVHDQSDGTVQTTPAPQTTPDSSALKDHSFFEAALSGEEEKVINLISGGINVNSRDEDGRTALMYAAFNGHSALIDKLVKKEADVNLKDNYGRTALMLAASGPFPAAVKYLLDRGAEPNLVDNEEHFTALMYAAAEGQIEVVKLLLQYHADPSLKDVDGDDARTFALNNGHKAVADLLASQTKK
jgi:ankyrin repeat protein